MPNHAAFVFVLIASLVAAPGFQARADAQPVPDATSSASGIVPTTRVKTSTSDLEKPLPTATPRCPKRPEIGVVTTFGTTMHARNGDRGSATPSPIPRVKNLSDAPDGTRTKAKTKPGASPTPLCT